MTEDRIARVVVAVVVNAMRDTNSGGVVLASPPRPETALLKRWLSAGSIDVTLPDADDVGAVADTLSARWCSDAATTQMLASEEAYRAAARMLASREGLLPTAADNKTQLIWGERLPPEPLLPLGDLYATEVRDLEGACTLPPQLTELDPDQLAVLDEALARVIDHGASTSLAFAGLPCELRDTASAALARSAWRGVLPPIVPKLGRRTLGVDLEL